MKRVIAKISDMYMTFPHDDIKFFDDGFPAGTYRIVDGKGGPMIVDAHDIIQKEPKLYGNAQKRVNKIISKWKNSKNSTGIIASGDKGMGKSLIASSVAARAVDELGLPVFIIDRALPDIVDFIDTHIGEAVIIFDEFEKNFKVGEANLSKWDISRRRDRRDAGESDRTDDQTQFLSMFDGMSPVKRMYILTVNDVTKVNNLFINRTGRFHYHFNFTYPDFDAIAEYMKDKVEDISDTHISDIQRLSLVTKLSYDHLRAIAIELNDTEGESVADIIDDLNIKNEGDTTLQYTIKTSISDKPFTTIENAYANEDGEFEVSFVGPRVVTGVDEDGDKIYDRSHVVVMVPAKDIDYKGLKTKFTVSKDKSTILDQDKGKIDDIEFICVTNYALNQPTYRKFASF